MALFHIHKKTLTPAATVEIDCSEGYVMYELSLEEDTDLDIINNESGSLGVLKVIDNGFALIHNGNELGLDTTGITRLDFISFGSLAEDILWTSNAGDAVALPDTEFAGGTQPTLNNGASYVSETVIASLTKCLLLDGINDYASFGEGGADDTASAFMIRFKFDAAAGMLLGLSTDPNAYLRIVSSTQIRLQISSGVFVVATFSAMSTGVWYCLHVIRDTGFVNIYIDDVDASEGGQALAGTFNFDQIGRYWDGSSGFWYDGKVSDFRLWNVVLTPTNRTDTFNGDIGSQATIARIPLNDNP